MIFAKWKKLPNFILDFSNVGYSFLCLNNIWTQTAKDSTLWRLECQTIIPGSYSQFCYGTAVCRWASHFLVFLLPLHKNAWDKISLWKVLWNHWIPVPKIAWIKQKICGLSLYKDFIELHKCWLNTWRGFVSSAVVILLLPKAWPAPPPPQTQMLPYSESCMSSEGVSQRRSRKFRVSCWN